MVKFIFLRHGSTEDNESMKLSGFIDSKLSTYGKNQVKKTFDRLKEENINNIFSSPLSRAKDSVKDIAIYKNLEIQISNNFKEMNFGDFEGLTFDEIKEDYMDEFEKLRKESFEYCFPKGENMIQFHKRIASELEYIKAKYDNNTILIASHAGVIRSCISHLICKDHTYHWNFKIDNCSLSIVEVIDDFAVIHSLNNTEHLR